MTMQFPKLQYIHKVFVVLVVLVVLVPEVQVVEKTVDNTTFWWSISLSCRPCTGAGREEDSRDRTFADRQESR